MKTTTGVILLVVAAAAGWWWVRRKQGGVSEPAPQFVPAPEAPQIAYSGNGGPLVTEAGDVWTEEEGEKIPSAHDPVAATSDYWRWFNCTYLGKCG